MFHGFKTAADQSPVVVSVTKENDAYVVLYLDQPRQRGPSMRHILPDIARKVHRHFRRAPSGLMFLHGSAVAKDKVGLVLLGESESGKSTLTLELLLRHGFVFLGDDMTAWNLEEEWVQAYPRPLCLRDDVAGRFPAFRSALDIPDTDLWYLHPWLENAATRATTCEAGYLVHATFRPDLRAPASLQGRERGEGRSRLGYSTWWSPALTRTELTQAHQRIAARFHYCRLFFRDATAAAERLRRLVEGA